MSNPLLKILLRDEALWPWEKKARDELNDVPEHRDEKLFAFKQEIHAYSKNETKFRPLLDDHMLMAFLRSRKFNVKIAMESYIKYFKIRLCNPKRIFPVGKGPLDYRRVFEKPLGVALRERNPIDGTVVIIWSFRNYDCNEDEVEDVFNGFFYAATKIIIHPSFQTYGVRFIFDLCGVNMTIVGSFLTRIYYNKALLMAQGSFPVRFKGLHAINNPLWGTQALYKLFCPFLPKKTRERIYFHGNQLQELHKFVSPSILPDVFGGSAGAFNAKWISDHIYDMHDEIVSDSYYGFV